MKKKVVKNQLNVGSSGTMVNICNYFCESFRFRVQSGHHLISRESSIGNLSDQDLSLATCMYPGLSVNFECLLRAGSYFLVTILSQHFFPDKGGLSKCFIKGWGYARPSVVYIKVNVSDFTKIAFKYK